MKAVPLDGVTESLQRVLVGDSPLVSITTQPPTSARIGVAGEQINIFLYGVRFDSHARNATPQRGASPESSPGPRVAMTLNYLLTAFTATGDELAAQRLLGRTMFLLHDRPVLLSADVTKLIGGASPDHRIESVRITPNSEDVPALWNKLGFGTYRLSVAYDVAVTFE